MYKCGSDGKESACKVEDPGSIPALGRSPGEGNGNPLQYSCLENPMDREAWQAPIHGVAKSQTWLSDFTFTFNQIQMWELDHKEAWAPENWSFCFFVFFLIDPFELWCWKRLVRVPWTARRSNQSILKEISPEYPLEGLMLKMKLQYPGHLMQRADSLEKTLMLGKIEGRRRRGWKDEMVGWHHWLDGHEFEQTRGDRKGQGSLACCSLWGQK